MGVDGNSVAGEIRYDVFACLPEGDLRVERLADKDVAIRRAEAARRLLNHEIYIAEMRVMHGSSELIAIIWNSSDLID